MTTMPPPVPLAASLPRQAFQAGLRRFTVAEYHTLIGLGLLTENDNLELLEGYLVHKMSRNPPHDDVICRLTRLLIRLVPNGWQVRIQCATTMDNSEPEPDGAIVRGGDGAFAARHPGPADFGIVIEVADTTLDGDRTDKARIYARNGLPTYWIINLVNRQVEVYTAPQSTANPPVYATRTDYRAGDAVPVELDGVTVGTLPVAGLMP